MLRLSFHIGNNSFTQKGVTQTFAQKMVESYRLRNSHIPTDYFNSYIEPVILDRFTNDPYYEQTFGDKTVADFFMCLDVRGTIIQIVWGNRLEQEQLRWDFNGTIVNANAIYNRIFNGVVIVSSVSSFDELRIMNLENEAGGGTILNDIYGYLPYHEHPKTTRITVAYTYQTGPLPWTNSHTFPELVHLCTGNTKYTSIGTFTASKMIELYLDRGLYSQAFPLFDMPLIQSLRAYGKVGESSFYGQIPFAGRTLNSLVNYITYQSLFTTGLELVDFHNATTVQGYNTNYTNHTFPNINAGSNLRDIRFDNCGFTDFTAQTFNNQMTMVSMRTNAIPTSGIDRIVATCYNGGAYRGTGATYRMNSGTNGTPGGTAQTQITEMRGAGATFTVNGF
jgi:hypothetical protein